MSKFVLTLKETIEADLAGYQPTEPRAGDCGIANPGGAPCTKAKGHEDEHDLSAYGPWHPQAPTNPRAQTATRPRFDWDYQELSGKHGIFEGNLLIAVVGECVSDQAKEQIPAMARQIIDDHNQHTKLVAALRELVNHAEADSDELWAVIAEARKVLTEADNA